MKLSRRTLCAALLMMFLLGNHKGYVALWKEGQAEPFQIFPCPVDSLPQEDQDALQNGVRARSELELAGLLEDYLS